ASSDTSDRRTSSVTQPLDSARSERCRAERQYALVDVEVRAVVFAGMLECGAQPEERARCTLEQDCEVFGRHGRLLLADCARTERRRDRLTRECRHRLVVQHRRIAVTELDLAAPAECIHDLERTR